MENIIMYGCVLDKIKEISTESVDLIITDPPYEVNYDKKSKELSKIGKSREKQIERDKSFIDIVPDYEKLCAEFYRILKKNTHLYIFCGSKNIHKWIINLEKNNFKNYQILVWEKPRTTFDMTFNHYYLNCSEFIIFAHKGFKKLNKYSGDLTKFKSVMKFKNSDDTKYHSCAKPISLLTHLIKMSSNENDLCLDCFAGSGNHLIAFKSLKRKYIGIEISEEYINIINKRLNNTQIITNYF